MFPRFVIHSRGLLTVTLLQMLSFGRLVLFQLRDGVRFVDLNFRCFVFTQEEFLCCQVRRRRQPMLPKHEITLPGNLALNLVAHWFPSCVRCGSVGIRCPFLSSGFLLQTTIGVCRTHFQRTYWLFGLLPLFMERRMLTCWPRDTPLSTEVGTKFRRQVAVDQSV
jgi:hypothetical protein